jgi:hypothetical protein
MKTNIKITLTSLIIILVANVSFGSSNNSFRMFINESKSIEVLTKAEELIEENLPVIADAINRVRFNNRSEEVMIVPVKDEMLVEEDLILVDVKQHAISVTELMLLLPEIQIMEQEIDDLDFDTKKIFNELKASNEFQLTPEDHKRFTKEENEVMEDLIFSNNSWAAAK